MPSQPKTVTTQSNQEKAPWLPAQPFFLDVYGKAQEALNATNKNPFMGDFVAQPGRDANMGLNLLRNVATGPAGKAITRGSADYLDMAAKTAKGDFLDPNSNPFIRAVVDAATRPMTQTFQNTVIPGIQDQSIMQGAYGGSGHGVAMGQASDALTRNIGDVSSNIFYQNYANERQNQINAPTMMGQGFDIANLPGQALLGIDAQRRQLDQLALDNTRQKFMEQKTAPWYGLGEMAQILSQGGFSTVTGQETKPNPAYVDPFTNMLKIALGTGSTVAGMGGKGGFGWWGGK